MKSSFISNFSWRCCKNRRNYLWKRAIVYSPFARLAISSPSEATREVWRGYGTILLWKTCWKSYLWTRKEMTKAQSLSSPTLRQWTSLHCLRSLATRGRDGTPKTLRGTWYYYWTCWVQEKAEQSVLGTKQRSPCGFRQKLTGASFLHHPMRQWLKTLIWSKAYLHIWSLQLGHQDTHLSATACCCWRGWSSPWSPSSPWCPSCPWSSWWTCWGSTGAWWERPSWRILVWSGPWESRWSSCKWWRNQATRPSRSWRWPGDSRQSRKRPWVARPWKRPGPFSWSAGCGASSRRGAEKDQRLDNFSPRTQPKSEKIKKEASQTIAIDCFLFLSF